MHFSGRIDALVGMANERLRGVGIGPVLVRCSGDLGRDHEQL